MNSAELDLLEAQLREKWGDIIAPRNLTPEEEVVAAKLLGKHEARKLADTPRGERYKYRPRRARQVRAEYYYVPPMEHRFLPSSHDGDFWAIDVIQDGRRRRFAELGWDKCRFAVKAMESFKIKVDFIGGKVPAIPLRKQQEEESPRKAMLRLAGGFAYE
tara:strand:+ start:871 stop:1350 length:480 start_codon:yes stop_codon:yes gene_type:complete